MQENDTWIVLNMTQPLKEGYLTGKDTNQNLWHRAENDENNNCRDTEPDPLG